MPSAVEGCTLTGKPRAEPTVDGRIREAAVMMSERVSVWISLIANIGVLLGGVLLVMELRHNALATQGVLHQELINDGREHVESLLSDENEKLADLVFRGEADP